VSSNIASTLVLQEAQRQEKTDTAEEILPGQRSRSVYIYRPCYELFETNQTGLNTHRTGPVHM